MVGGEVIGIVRTAKHTLLNVRDAASRDTCAVRLLERRRETGEPVTIALGDVVWWRGNDLMWTPGHMQTASVETGGGRTWDIPLPRIGAAH
jgi:hypothetical protein